MPNAEVISIGEELVTGQRLDTNSQWLSQRLGELGIAVRYHTTVGDAMESNVAAFRRAAERAEVIVATGGLGPTADDLTRHALAAAKGVGLVLDEGALSHLRGLFARRGRPMPPANEIQAHFPAGGRVIPNPHGTAPGIDMELASPGRMPARVFALPGVPAEMRQMWEQTVAPALATAGPRRVILHRQIRCFGVGESDLEQMLGDLIRRGRHPLVGITASLATLTLRMTAEGDSPEACHAAIEPTAAKIRQTLGDLVFGEGEDELEHAVARLLRARGQTLATVERGTAGLVARWLGELPDANEFFAAGIVCGGQTALASALRMEVPAFAGEPERFTQEAAEACRRMFASDFGLAVGPFTAAEAGAVPHVVLALASPEQTVVQRARVAGHPEIHRPRAAKQALDMLRRALLARVPGA
jgi:nicotinamide-nucleotide amidase